MVSSEKIRILLGIRFFPQNVRVGPQDVRVGPQDVRVGFQDVRTLSQEVPFTCLEFVNFVFKMTTSIPSRESVL